MTEPRILRIEADFKPPAGTLGLGTGGWLPDTFERLTIYTPNPLTATLERIWYENKGLLGEGQFVFATQDEKGRPDRTPQGEPCTAYEGYILFVPDEEAMREPEIPPDTPENISTFIRLHFEDFRKLAAIADPDSVLVSWLGQKTFGVQAVPRAKFIEDEPDSTPDQVKAGPLPLEPGAERTLWLALCAQGEKDTTISWCSMSFYPEPPRKG